MRSKRPVSLAGLGAVTALSFFLANDPASAQSGGRGQMERCTDRVLSGLARTKAPEAQAGAAVVSQCDGPLRAAVADAIRSGEAFICSSVDMCMPMAQQRASYEARDRYRQFLQR